jgi:hypothetical protein
LFGKKIVFQTNSEEKLAEYQFSVGGRNVQKIYPGKKWKFFKSAILSPRARKNFSTDFKQHPNAKYSQDFFQITGY